MLKPHLFEQATQLADDLVLLGDSFAQLSVGRRWAAACSVSFGPCFTSHNITLFFPFVIRKTKQSGTKWKESLESTK
jgi:hypothetical protein